MNPPNPSRSTEPGTPHLLIPRSEVEEKLRARIVEGNEILNRSYKHFGEADSRKNEYRVWDDYNQQLLLNLFSTASFAKENSSATGSLPLGAGRAPSLTDERKRLSSRVKAKINKLESIIARLPLIPEAPAISPPLRNTAPKQSSRKVFLVHGHDDGTKETVARFLGKLDLDVVILHEQVNAGRTIIEKLEHHSEDCDFAIILMTPDDVGSVDNGEDVHQHRARQNVILELGYFMGKLGRAQVVALYKGDIELPSDIHDILYVPLDVNGAWRLLLAREIQAGGLSIDLNKAI